MLAKEDRPVAEQLINVVAKEQEMKKQPNVPSRVSQSLVWLWDNSRMIVGLALAIFALGVAIKIIYVAGWNSPQATTDAIVAFMAESPCQAIAIREQVQSGQQVTEISLKRTRQRCLAATSGREAVRQFDAIQAQAEQQPGI